MKSLRRIEVWYGRTSSQIDSIPDWLFDIPGLRWIDFSDQRISEIPQAIGKLDYLRGLILGGNTLMSLPESLFTLPSLRRLTQGDYHPDERKTEGIDVTRWNLAVDDAEIAVNLWDFGGQEIMHATHQFFLTRRSVYLLVIDARQSEEQNRIEYWLKVIQGFSAGSPVIVVGNKCEKFSLDIDHRGLRKKYPEIVDIIETSCATNMGVDEVRESLRRTIGGLAHVRDMLPASFFAVKEHLEELDADYLPFPDYEVMCRERGVDTSAAQELLVGFLHDLGTVLCFRTDPRLRDTNILNPSWVTGGVPAAQLAPGRAGEGSAALGRHRRDPGRRPLHLGTAAFSYLGDESERNKPGTGPSPTLSTPAGRPSAT